MQSHTLKVHTTWNIACKTVKESELDIGKVNKNFKSISIAVNMYVLPCCVIGKGPNKSICQILNGSDGVQ